MDRDTAIAVTGLIAFLSLPPGLSCCCLGVIFSMTGLANDLSDPGLAFVGVIALSAGALLCLVPVVVGLLTIRRKQKPAEVIDIQEQLPPAI